MAFEKAIETQTNERGQEVWRPDPAWNQGRGIYGGLTFAVIVQSVESQCALPIRRLSVELCAPISSQPCMVATTLHRQGKKTAFFSSTLEQEGHTVALAHITCGANRSCDLDHHPKESRPVPNGPAVPNSKLMPDFAQFFDYWPEYGFPMAGMPPSEMKSGGWIRPRFESPSPQRLIAAVIDAWWPAALVSSQTMRPMGTMSFALDFLSTHITPSPCFLDVQTQVMKDGYGVEHDRLWNKDGTLLAVAQQNVALIA